MQTWRAGRNIQDKEQKFGYRLSVHIEMCRPEIADDKGRSGYKLNTNQDIQVKGTQIGAYKSKVIVYKSRANPDLGTQALRSDTTGQISQGIVTACQRE